MVVVFSGGAAGDLLPLSTVVLKFYCGWAHTRIARSFPPLEPQNHGRCSRLSTNYVGSPLHEQTETHSGTLGPGVVLSLSMYHREP